MKLSTVLSSFAVVLAAVVLSAVGAPLAAAEQGDFFLAPPTFLTLMELAQLADGAALRAAAERREVRPILPRLDLNEGVSIVLPGHPSYPSERPAEAPAHRLTASGGTWRLG